MPLPIAVYFMTSAGTDTSALVSPSFTPSNGELITVGANTWDTANPAGAVTGGAQTFLTKALAQPGGFNGYSRIDAATVAGSPGAMQVTVAGTATPSRHSACVIRWPSTCFLDAPPATGTPVSGSGAPASTIAPAGIGSALLWAWTDVASLDPAALALRLAGTLAGVMDGHVGANSVQYYAYAQDAAPHVVGATAPAPQVWAQASLEIREFIPPAGTALIEMDITPGPPLWNVRQSAEPVATVAIGSSLPDWEITS